MAWLSLIISVVADFSQAGLYEACIVEHNEEVAARALDSAVTGRTVLLVQPDDDSREMYVEFLEHKGLTPVAVSTGAEALRAARAADVIVTGLLLSGEIDGFELMTELRANDNTRAIPIIVLTTSAWTSERERAERVGCDAFLPKPCAPDALVREIGRVLASAKLTGVRGKPSTAQSRRRRSKRSA